MEFTSIIFSFDSGINLAFGAHSTMKKRNTTRKALWSWQIVILHHSQQHIQKVFNILFYSSLKSYINFNVPWVFETKCTKTCRKLKITRKAKKKLNSWSALHKQMEMKMKMKKKLAKFILRSMNINNYYFYHRISFSTAFRRFIPKNYIVSFGFSVRSLCSDCDLVLSVASNWDGAQFVCLIERHCLRNDNKFNDMESETEQREVFFNPFLSCTSGWLFMNRRQHNDNMRSIFFSFFAVCFVSHSNDTFSFV